MKKTVILLACLCSVLEMAFGQENEILTKLTEVELDGTFKADDLCMQGDYLYAISDFSVEELKIFNISDPSNPVEIGSFEFGFDLDPGSLIINGDVLYIGSNVSGTKDASFVIMDVSNPADPSLIKSYFDIPRIDDPSKAARQVTGLRDIRDNIIYATSGTFNLVYLDVTDPLNVNVIGGYGDSFGTLLFSGIGKVKILDHSNAWLDRNDFRHATVSSNGALTVGSNQGVTGELYDFEFRADSNIGYAATWQGSAANVVTFENNGNVITELGVLDIDDSIGGFGFNAEVEIFEKSNVLFVQGVVDFLALDISNSAVPTAILAYEGDSYLRIHRDFLVVQGFNGSMIFYKINFTNEGPTIEDQLFDINESETNGIMVGQVVASDTDNDNLSYSILSGNDIGTFEINGETGEIIVADETTLDFENNPQYILTIEVSDGFETATAEITINVLEINLPPEVSDEIFDIPEQNSDNTLVGEVEGSDPENENLTYTIISGNESDIFSINENTGSIVLINSAGLNFDTDPSYILTVEVSDGVMVSNAQITININENQAPQIASQTFTISENIFGTTSLGIIEVSDEEEDELVFSIVEGNGTEAFEIDIESGELFVLDNGVLNFANSPTLQIEVEVFDGLDKSIAIITINVTENGDPQITAQNFSISENTSDGFSVGIVSASDPEEDPLTFEITHGNLSATFNIEAETGEIFVLNNEALNFANSPTLEIGISVYDGLDLAAATITINLTENEAPEIEDQSFTISENTANEESIGTLSASDNNDDVLSFRLVSGNDLEAFSLNSESGQINVGDSSKLDFDSNPLFELVVEVFDGQKVASATVSVNLTENFAPVAEDSQYTVNENITSGSEIGIILASDVNDDALVYSIISGNETNLFALNSATGQLSLSDLSILDFETTFFYELSIEVTDGKLSDKSSVIIDVVDIDEAPIVDNEPFSIDENSQDGTIVGQLNASDPEGNAIVFTIDSGNQDGIFALDEDSGELSVVDSTKLDFEINPTIILMIAVSDGSLSAVRAVTIDVNDINEKPTVQTQEFTIKENPEKGTELGVIESSDPDDDILVYSIVSGDDSGSFSITTNTGLLSVSDSTLLDFEVYEAVNLTIQVTDGDLSANTVVVVTLTDMNEMPQIVDQEFVLIGESPNGTVIGSIEAVDPENDDLSYSIKSGNDNDIFGLDENTGELTVLNIDLLDFENTQSVLLEVGTSDAEFTSAATITINLEEKVVAGLRIEQNDIIRVYPNPANHYTFVELENTKNERFDLLIYSLNGKIVLSKKFKGGRLNLSNLNSGTYLLILKKADQVKGKFKLLVER